MEMFNVTLNNEIVGSVCVTCVGLYMNFECSCRIPKDKIYRLHMNCCGKNFDLGICVPAESQFVVHKKIQAKQIPEGEKIFYLESGSQCKNCRFVAVSADAPFAHISMLEDANLYRHHDKYGIVIKDQPKSI